VDIEVEAALQVRAPDLSRSRMEGVFLVAKENAVSLASDKRVTDAAASLAAMSRMAARPSAHVGNR
jgi:hypothetical protein